MRAVSDHRAVLEEYRGLREALETSVLPLATSVDGRRFEYQASLHGLELEAGGYVAIDARGEIRLGQVLSLRMEQHEVSAHRPPGHRPDPGRARGRCAARGRQPPVPRRARATRDQGGGVRLARAVTVRARPTRGRRAGGRPRRAIRARRCRLRPAYLPVWPVRFGEDLLARRAAGAAADADQPADRRAGPELGLRAAWAAEPRGGRRVRGALPHGSWVGHGAQRNERRDWNPRPPARPKS